MCTFVGNLASGLLAIEQYEFSAKGPVLNVLFRAVLGTLD